MKDMKIDLPDILKHIPFHFTGFVVLILAGLIRIIYDGNNRLIVVIKSIILLLLLGTLISIITSVFDFSIKWVVITMAILGYLSGYILNALTNIGERIEKSSPDWFENIVEGYLTKKLENYKKSKEDEEDIHR